MENPYPEFVVDSGVEVPNEKHRTWKEGYEAALRDPLCGIRRARQHGRKEVVEWIVSHQDGMMAGKDIQAVAGNNCAYGNTSHILVRWLDFESKVKEWALEG